MFCSSCSANRWNSEWSSVGLNLFIQMFQITNTQESIGTAFLTVIIVFKTVWSMCTKISKIRCWSACRWTRLKNEIWSGTKKYMTVVSTCNALKIGRYVDIWERWIPEFLFDSYSIGGGNFINVCAKRTVCKYLFLFKKSLQVAKMKHVFPWQSQKFQIIADKILQAVIADFRKNFAKVLFQMEYPWKFFFPGKAQKVKNERNPG